MSSSRYSYASPASSTGSRSGGSGSGSGSAPVDPFYEAYPRAPHMRPIDLPIMSPAPAIPDTLAPTRGRVVSSPPDGSTGALGIYNHMHMPSPPASPYSSVRSIAGSYTSNSTNSSTSSYNHHHTNTNIVPPSVHPLLRAPQSPNTTPTLLYNVLTHPSSAQLVHSALYASSDLSAPATNPPTPALRVRVVSYPSGLSTPAGSQHVFPWDIALSLPRQRTSLPHPSSQAQMQMQVLTLKDVLKSIHTAMHTPVSDPRDLARFTAHQLQCARASASVRLSSSSSASAAAGYNGNKPNELIRADFLYGCTQFAGFVRNQDNSFVLVMLPPPRY